MSITAVNHQQETRQDIDDCIALQMYTMRNSGSIDDQFALAQLAGFQAVELVSNQGLGAEQLLEKLAKHKLKVTSAHIPLSALTDNFEQTVAFHQAINNRNLVMPWLTPEQRPTSAMGWQQFAQQLAEFGARLGNAGIQLSYHNHNYEMKKYQGTTALEIMLQNSGKEQLKFEMDVAWIFRGGQDPARFIQSYSDRIFALHVKDDAPIGVRDNEMNFAPFGEGLLDWTTIIPAAADAAVRWYIIEHDKPLDAMSIIKQSRHNLRKALSGEV